MLGSRKVILTSTVALLGYLTSVEKEKEIGLKDAYSFLREATVEQATDYMAHSSLYQCTVNPGVILYVPPGSLFSETVVTNENCVGCRRQCVAQSHMAAFESLDKCLTMIGEPNLKIRALTNKCFGAD